MTRYRDPDVDLDAEWERAEIEAIERALDHASWRSVRPLFLALLLVLVSLWGWSVHAATADLTCTPPTQNTDNTPITSQLAYKAYWGTNASTLGSVVDLAGPGCKGSVSVPDAPAGSSATYFFAVTAISQAGLESAKSNVASRIFTTAPPKPPVLQTVDTVGYQQNLGSRNKVSLSRVATVPLGKPCTEFKLSDPIRTVHIIMDRLWATMDPNPKKPGEFFTRPNQVWAKCELI